MPTTAVFDKPTQPVPVAVGPMEYDFTDFDGTSGNVTATCTVLLLDEDGRNAGVTHVHQLKQYLTQQEQQQLWAMFQRLRALAYDELIEDQG